MGDLTVFHLQLNADFAPIEPRLARKIKRKLAAVVPFPACVARLQAVNFRRIERVFRNALHRKAVNRAKRLRKRLFQPFDREIGAELAQVAHARAHGRNALCAELCLRRAQIPPELLHIHIYKQRAMMIRLAAAVVKRIAGEFFAIGKQIISAGNLRRNAERAARAADHGKLPGQIIVLRGDEKGKIQIAEIMENSAAAGKTARKAAALLREQLRAAFFPGVLVAADHNRVLVLPEVERAAASFLRFEQDLLDGEIAIGISSLHLAQLQFPNHCTT